MSFARKSSSSQRKRGREEEEWGNGLNFDDMEPEEPKRARLAEDEEVEGSSVVGVPSVDVKGEIEDDFDPLGLGLGGGDMGEAAEDKPKSRAVEGDTSGWTLRQLITKRVVGQEPGLGNGEEREGRRANGELAMPTVRSSSGRSAVMAPPVDVDPALGFYEAPSLQVRIGEDGRVILDAASAIVRQQQEVDLGPRREIQGGRTHITSATYAKHSRSERWTPEDVELLYEALSMCGTDFSMVEVFFPTRTRAHIKARFKKEEKEHPARVNAALKARVPIDVEDFKRLIAIKKQASLPNAKASASAPSSKASSARASAAPSGTQTPSSVKTPKTTADPAHDSDDDLFDLPVLPTTKEKAPSPKPATPPSAPRPLSPVLPASAPPSPGGFETSALNYDDLG
jgi:hypothetical protein